MKKLIDVAMGREKADLVLKNARVVNVFTERIEQKDVAVCDGRIAGLGVYNGEIEIDMKGRYIAPGFMDAHMHLESSLITPAQYERAAVIHGTTAVVADPHEIANVAGTDGLDYMLQSARDLRMHVYFTLSSCVPAAPLEESGETLEAPDLLPYYRYDNIVGLAEVMNSLGVTMGDENLLKKIADAHDNGRVIDGHAPFLEGKDLNAYTAAGVHSDHECTDAKEALEKMDRGQWIMIREGTAAKNLRSLMPLCAAPYCYRALFCTDDRHPEDLLGEGHMDNILRKAVAWGADPIKAIRMCTLNTATYFKLKDSGAVAPGYLADLVVLSDLESFTVEEVYIGGKAVAKDGVPLFEAPLQIPDNPKITGSFHMGKVSADLLKIPEIKRFMRIIRLKEHELLTDEMILEATEKRKMNNGYDPDMDILKAAVFERHHNTGHIGIGFITGYGIKRGAIATSVAHDSHNLIVIGACDEDIATAAEAVRQMNGGLVVVENGEVKASLALPIAGLMSELSVEEVEKKLRELKAATKELGASDDIDPFMTLAFVSLPVIPVLRLNGKGLINVNTQEIVEPTF